MRFVVFCLLLCLSPALLGQSVGINALGSPGHSSSILDLSSTSKGFLLPRMTNAQMNAIILPAKSLLIYNTTNNLLWTNYGTATTPYWQPIGYSSWSLLGNTGTNVTDFVGSTNNMPLIFKTNNIVSGTIDPVGRNTFFGYQTAINYTTALNNVGIGSSALKNLSTGYRMVAIGDSAMYFATDGNSAWTVAIGARTAVKGTLAYYNTYVGFGAGRNVEVGQLNTALGSYAMNSIDSDHYILAIGSSALRNMTNLCDSNVVVGDSAMFANAFYAYENTVVGHKALKNMVRVGHSTFLGYEAGLDVIGGSDNIGIGYRVLRNNNINGFSNIAIGHFALEDNTNGAWNIAIGDRALHHNAIGNHNLAIGEKAASDNMDGDHNIAIGHLSLTSVVSAEGNIAIGDSALHSLTIGGGNNTVIGKNAGMSATTGDQNVFIGNGAAASNTTGDFNVAVGNETLFASTTGDGNTAAGRRAGSAFVNGSHNTFLGAFSNADAAGWGSSVAIGYNSTITATNQVRVGFTSTNSIGGYQAWSNISDGRYKNDIRQNVPGLEFIALLKPVSYKLDINKLNTRFGKTDEDFASKRSCGFIAQQVEDAAMQINFDFSGIDSPQHPTDMYGLRYAEFVVPLVKAVQEQQLQIDKLKIENAELLQQLEEIINE